MGKLTTDEFVQRAKERNEKIRVYSRQINQKLF